MVLADASVPIALAKMRKLDLLKKVYSEVLIGPVVKREVVDQGRKIAATEIDEVERALAEGWLRTVHLRARERKSASAILKAARVDDGEAEAIAIAKARKLPLVVDDREARGLAAAMGIEHVGTAGVLLQAYLGGYLEFEALEEAVRDLSRALWLSPAVAIEIVRTAREMRK